MPNDIDQLEFPEIIEPLALTRRNAAKALGVSVQTLDRFTSRGLINPVRAFRRPLYPKAELERFLHDTLVTDDTSSDQATNS